MLKDEPATDSGSGTGMEASVNPVTGTIDQYPIRLRRVGDPDPVRILVRHIDMVPRDQGGPFVFVGPDQAWPYSANRLTQILDGLRQGRYASRPPVSRCDRPLDVNCSDTTLFIFRLSDNWDWRFAAKAKGVTLGWFANSGERDNYFDLRHVLDDSAGSEVPFEHPDMCKIVYFTAKKTPNSFAHAFNINVEIVYPDDPLGNPNTLPIVIDPDVRHPGGSGQ
jgi:hypothetical protein